MFNKVGEIANEIILDEDPELQEGVEEKEETTTSNINEQKLRTVNIMDLNREIRKIFFKRALGRIPCYENQEGVDRDIRLLEGIWGVDYGICDTPKAPKKLKRARSPDNTDSDFEEQSTPKSYKHFKP